MDNIDLEFTVMQSLTCLGDYELSQATLSFTENNKQHMPIAISLLLLELGRRLERGTHEF